jgi:hypothetical protein
MLATVHMLLIKYSAFIYAKATIFYTCKKTTNLINAYNETNLTNIAIFIDKISFIIDKILLISLKYRYEILISTTPLILMYGLIEIWSKCN